MVLNDFVKNTLGELMLVNITQAAQIAELQQKLAEALEEAAKLKGTTKSGGGK